MRACAFGAGLEPGSWFWPEEVQQAGSLSRGRKGNAEAQSFEGATELQAGSATQKNKAA